MDTLLTELESVLERYMEHKAIGEDLDHVTTSLMVHDDYEEPRRTTRDY